MATMTCTVKFWIILVSLSVMLSSLITSLLWYYFSNWEPSLSKGASSVILASPSPTPNWPTQLFEQDGILTFNENDIYKQRKAIQMDLVRLVNSQPNRTWTARFNPSSTLVPDNWKTLLANPTTNQLANTLRKTQLIKDIQPSLAQLHSILRASAIPDEFDSRVEWPECPRLRQPSTNQGSCGSCWVISVTSALSDRYCIHSNGTDHAELSAEDVLSEPIMHPAQAQMDSIHLEANINLNGCQGGDIEQVVRYWVNKGIVSGGPYGEPEGASCLPYTHHAMCGYPCAPTVYLVTKTGQKTTTPKCSPLYNKTYLGDKRKGQFGYYTGRLPLSGNITRAVLTENMKLIQRDIMRNGPVSACFKVFEDFLHYHSGVYQHTFGAYLYGHCAKIIGWGKLNTTDYWLISNSWGESWGDQGFVKLLRGSNHLDIENLVLAGLM